jgi:hypothetical protein
MSRRESQHNRRSFGFSLGKTIRRAVGTTAHTPDVKSPTSPVEILARSMSSMKRFFMNSKNIPRDEKPIKRVRLHRKTAKSESISPRFASRVSESGTRSTLLIDRNRRNGVVFDDVTICVNNISPTKPSAKVEQTACRLSDIDFTKPQPDWLTTAILHTGQESLPSVLEPSKLISHRRSPTDRPVKVIQFLALSEYEALQTTTNLSISALPARPSYLQKTLFSHITNSLLTVLNRAESSLQEAWGARHLTLPEHFVTALIYLTSTLESAATILTSEPILPSDIGDTTVQFSSIVSIVVETVSIVDGLDIRNLIDDSTRKDVTTRLGAVLLRIIAVSSHAEEFGTMLESVAEKLPSSVPTVLLPHRLQLYKSMIKQHLNSACDCIVNGSAISPIALDKLDKFLPMAKTIQRQLNRLALEENEPVDHTSRQDLVTYDLQRTMLQVFLDGRSATSPVSAITFYDLAKTLAEKVDQVHIQAECMYQIASVATTCLEYSGTPPLQLLAAARQLNSSATFQRKVDDLKTTIHRRSVSTLLDLALLVQQADDLNEFIDGVKIFVSTLLECYPAQGIDGETVLDDDLVKGLLKVIRVFHPDKNTSVDEEGRWVCEELTKVFAQLQLRLILGLEQDD